MQSVLRGQFVRRLQVIVWLAAVGAQPIGVSAQVVRELITQDRQIGGKAVRSERDEQESLFNYYFRDQALKYEVHLDQLKQAASVPGWRIPYSADIHPQSAGGLGEIGGRRRYASGSSALSLYDLAFNDGEGLANSYEVRRILGADRALFPGLRMRRMNEGWEGYCSGFTASTIRHPEPVNPVDARKVGGRPGVVFQPSDIKALLSCIYNRTTDDSFLYLAPPTARDGGPNMGTFHLALANYIGQGRHPIGFDRTKGETSWNNPIYAYKVTSIKDAGSKDHIQLKTVETTITYSFYGSDTQSQTDRDNGNVQGNQKQTMVLRYNLYVDDTGAIVGGSALSSSGHFLWIPLYAVQAKRDGTSPGNPYIDTRKIIDLARASALPETQKKFDAATVGPQTDPSLAEDAPQDAAD